MNELPSGWTNATLGEICSKPQYGWTSKASRKGRIKYVRTSDISRGGIYWDEVPFCELEPEDIDKFRVREDDILVSRAGSVGVSLRIGEVPYDAVFASYLIRFKSLELVLPKYIECFLKSQDYWRSISEFSAGIAIPNVNASKLAELEVPLPPVNEQCRIVAKLEKLLTRVYAAQERLATIPRILKRFRQSVLSAACSGSLTADWRQENDKALENWEESKLVDLLSEPLSNGRSVVDARTGFPVLRLTCLKNGKIDLSEWKIGAWTYDVAKRFVIAKNDFFVSRGNGSLSHVGRGGLVDEEPDPVAFPDTLIRVRIRKELIDPRFLRETWRSKSIREQIESAAHTTAGIWKISQKDIEGFVLPVPGLSEQQEIVRRIEALFKTADALEAHYLEAKAHVDKLTQSILAKAFRGELVPQDSNDEPASVLLDRIRYERNQIKPNKRVNRR